MYNVTRTIQFTTGTTATIRNNLMASSYHQLMDHLVDNVQNLLSLFTLSRETELLMWSHFLDTTDKYQNICHFCFKIEELIDEAFTRNCSHKIRLEFMFFKYNYFLKFSNIS